MFGGPSIPLFRLLGFKVGAHWSFFLALAVAGLTRGGVEGVALSLMLFVSVLLHELGHSVIARRRGVPILGIDLHFFGGVAKMATPPRSPNDEVAIAIAGPVVSLLLGVGFGALFWATGSSLIAWLAGANLMLAIFNMVPALPLDGGRVFRALLAKRAGLYRGTRWAVSANRVFAVLIAALGLWTNPWLIVMAVLVWTMGTAELRNIEQHAALMNLKGWYPVSTPWERYDRAAERERRGVSPISERFRDPEVLEPEIIVPRMR